MNRKEKIIWIWLITGAVMVFLMVAIGGITRLTHSGLSMVDWNPIMGFIPPTSDAAWHIAFEKYKQYPEFRELNNHFTIDDFKSIFWWEYIHRLFGRLMGLVFLIPFVFFLAKKWLTPSLKKHLIVIFVLGGFQAFLGWYMVKSGLNLEPRVSHYRLAAHLITAFVTCMYIWWVAMGLKHKETSLIDFPDFRRVLKWIFALSIAQIVFGAFVAGLKAGWVHNTYPLMDGQLVADAVWALDPIYLNFIEGKSGVQFAHRTLAIIVLGVIGYSYFKALRMPLTSRQITSVRWMFITVMFQFLLGVFTLLFQVPLLLGILHQLGALVLLGSVLASVHSLRVTST
ncbi:MAG: COX15/CtaA family protein [Flavobacteriales bacterium]|nr:COX15/CtaA family protein [Flavobacteriales bacterium]